MLLKKMWRTLLLYKTQFLSMIIMIAIGVGVFVGMNMEWYSLKKNTDEFYEATGFADYRIISESGFSKADAQAVADISGVDRAARFLSVTVDVKDGNGDTLSLAVTEDSTISGFLVNEGSEYDETSEDAIWLSEAYAKANQLSVGDELTLSYNNFSISGTIAGLVQSAEFMICVRDESQLMPDYDTHGYAYISPAMYHKVMPLDLYPQIYAVSDLDKKEFVEAADEALGNTLAILTKNETMSYAGAKGEIEEGQTMGNILPVLFLVIAMLTMITTMHRIASKEKVQIGTLKALGFTNRKILIHYTSYTLIIGAFGSVLGIILGYGIGAMILNPNGMMGTYLDMPSWKLTVPGFCVLVLIVLLVLITIIGYISVKQMLSGNAADALRPFTPKAMSALFIEKSKLFHKLSFGTRWNLRDILRHKSRTAMSLLGVFGCTVIVVAALGMQDTMNAFLDLYYQKATNYNSRIYVAQDATDRQVQTLLKRYNGDWSASVSVQLEDKAVSLDVYHIEHDRIRFLDEQDDFTQLEDDVAYICKRIAREFKLKEGDTFTVTPYGTDQEYELTVGGIVQSMTESIIITDEYAKLLELEYQTGSIYTDAAKESIAEDASIQSVQSKQMIIDSFDSFLEIMDMMIYILIVAAALLAVVVLYNLGVMSYTERYREMATLKVIGFNNSQIARLLISQNLWISIVGTLIGMPIGAAVLKVLLNALASEYEMRMYLSATSYLISAAITLGVSFLVSFMVARKNRHIDMVEALKGD